MKAAILKEINSYPVIENIEIALNENLQRVKLSASALNHRDLWICKGMYAGIVLPIVLGSDGVGLCNDRRVIINPGQEWGSDQRCQSKDFKVLGLPDYGCFAEAIGVQGKYLYDVPTHLSDEQAAALPLAGLTAFRVLLKRAVPLAGDKVLITGIGGGVALFVLQFAVASGLEVYVSSGDQNKIEKAMQLGAAGGVNYKDDNWHKDLKKMSGGGFDVIIDSAGGDAFSNLIWLANPGARIALYGGTQGNYNNISPQMIFWKQLNILGSTMGSDQDFEEMLTFVNQHQIVPIIDSVHDLADIAIAFRRMEEGKQFGKIVLRH